MKNQYPIEYSIIIPGPDFDVDLPALDALFPVHYSRRLFIFRCDSPEQRETQLAALKKGLHVLVSRCPLLGGTITPLSGDAANHTHSDWRTIIPGPGVELVVRDLQAAIASFQELETANFPSFELPYNLLVPIPQSISNDRPFAACKIQLSAIRGGTIIAFAMSHSIADGSGTNELMRILAEETRSAQEHTITCMEDAGHPIVTDTIVGLDRSVLRNMTSEVVFNIEDHSGYALTDTTLLDGSSRRVASTHPFEAALPEIPILFRLPKTKLAQLKANATQLNKAPISTHDALTALLWRSVLLIRSRRSPCAQSLPSSTIGSVFLPSDARRHVDLPLSYVGNVVYQLTAALPLTTLFSPSGMQHAASAVRRAISNVNPTLVSSYLAQVNKNWVDWAFLGSASTTGVAMGTDWTSGSVYTHSWGEAFGPLIRYRYPNEAFNCILPRLPNGDAEVLVSIMPDEVELLSSVECFGSYLEC